MFCVVLGCGRFALGRRTWVRACPLASLTPSRQFSRLAHRQALGARSGRGAPRDSRRHVSRKPRRFTGSTWRARAASGSPGRRVLREHRRFTGSTSGEPERRVLQKHRRFTAPTRIRRPGPSGRRGACTDRSSSSARTCLACLGGLQPDVRRQPRAPRWSPAISNRHRSARHVTSQL